MSSAEATVDDTVRVSTSVGGGEGTRAAAVLAVLAVTQVGWLGGLVYGAVRLLA